MVAAGNCTRDGSVMYGTERRFVRASAVKEAKRVLRELQTTTLSKRDWRTLMEALDNPPPPTQAARDMVRGYRSRIASAG